MFDVHKNENEHDMYNELFIRFSDSVEKWMIRIGVSLLLLFVFCQLLLQIPSVRHTITKVDQLEGVPAALPVYSNK